MLRFYTGPSKSGKSEYLKSLAVDLASQGKKVLFVVPEQVSFSKEKEFYDLSKAHDTFLIEVSSFKKLCEDVFKSLGGGAKGYIDAGGKALLMWRSLKEVRDLLSIFKKASHSRDFALKMVSFCDDMHSLGLDASSLLKLAGETDTLLKEKCTETAIIYDTYTALLERSYKDPQKTVAHALELLTGSEVRLADAIFFDSFSSFSVPEMELIMELAKKSEDIHISLDMKGISIERDMSVFAPVKAAARKLVSLCDKYGISYKHEKDFSENSYFSSEDLRCLSEAIADSGVFEKEASDIEIASFSVPYNEARYISAKIKELTKNGYRFSDIGVYCSDDGFFSILENELTKYGISFYSDKKRTVLSENIFLFVCTVLSNLCGKLNTDNLLALLGSGFLRVSAEDIALFENYCYIWSIKGESFKDEFSLHPEGFCAHFSEKDKEKLIRINGVRRAIIEPIMKLRKSVSNTSSEKITAAIFTYLNDDIKLSQTLSEMFAEDKLLSEEAVLLKDKTSQIYSSLISVLDGMYSLLPETEISIDDYTELFKIYAGSTNVSFVPQSKDCVILSLNNIYPLSDKKVVFLSSVNDGVFCAGKDRFDVFSDKEKASMEEQNSELWHLSWDDILDSKYMEYKLLTSARDRLILTYSSLTSDGSEVFPAEAVSVIKKAFPLLKTTDEKDIDHSFYCRNDESAFSVLAESFRENSVFCESLKSASLSASLKERIEHLQKAEPKAIDSFKDSQLVERILGDTLNFSATNIETYHQCKFKHFCRYVIGIKPLKKAELSPIETGSLIHYCLENAVKKLYSENKALSDYTKEDVDAIIKVLLDEYLDGYLGGISGKDGRFMYLYKRIYRSLCSLMEHMIKELSVCSFIPCDFEFDIKNSSDITPVEIALKDGKKAILQGSIDRVDMYSKNGEKYIRVVDYKSGTKDFNLNEVYYGLNMQMLIYLFSLWFSGKNKYENCSPAGILYMPAGESSVLSDRHSTDSDINDAKNSSYKMKGLLLGDIDILEKMESPLKGVFIPAKIDEKSGDISSKSIISADNFATLKKHIDKLLYSMAEHIYKGDAKILPSKNGDFLSCEFCDYKDVCGREENDDFKEIESFSTTEAIERMEGENG